MASKLQNALNNYHYFAIIIFIYICFGLISCNDSNDDKVVNSMDYCKNDKELINWSRDKLKKTSSQELRMNKMYIIMCEEDAIFENHYYVDSEYKILNELILRGDDNSMAQKAEYLLYGYPNKGFFWGKYKYPKNYKPTEQQKEEAMKLLKIAEGKGNTEAKEILSKQ